MPNFLQISLSFQNKVIDWFDCWMNILVLSNPHSRISVSSSSTNPTLFKYIWQIWHLQLPIVTNTIFNAKYMLAFWTWGVPVALMNSLILLSHFMPYYTCIYIVDELRSCFITGSKGLLLYCPSQQLVTILNKQIFEIKLSFKI